MKKIFFILSLMILCLYGKQNIDIVNIQNDKIFVLPEENNKSVHTILNLIKNSKNNIVIAMYNFSYKKFAKALVKAKKRGLIVKVLLDKLKIKKKDKIFKYFKNNNIDVKIIDKKLHLKVAIFDNNYAVFGSSNWTKESFEENYELIFLTHNKNIISKLYNFIDKIKD